LDENTAHLEYIAIAPEFRGLGLGTALLKEVLTDIFSYDEVQQITLTVNNTNDQANYVYFKAGFQKKDLLWSFILK
jgi:ribosomal protein S18 acetylase RimI-like enzyme